MVIMKNQKSTKTYAESGNVLLTQLKKHVEDSYYLDVLYYYFRKALIELDFNLGTYKKIAVNGRYFGDKKDIVFSPIFNSVLKSLSLVLSLRAIMLNKEYINACYSDKLLFYEIEPGFLGWNSHRAIVECYDDDDFYQVYNMIVDIKDGYSLSEEQKEEFKSFTIKPEYRNADKYCRAKAADPDYNGQSIIKNYAFLCSDFDKYVIPEYIEYVGDTAFAYCRNLHTLVFTKKVMLGYFPVIECPKLKQIIVPTEYLDYYKKELSFYASIITDKEIDESDAVVLTPIEELVEELIEEPETQLEKKEETEIETVYVDIPSAEPFTEIELPTQETALDDVQEEKRKSIDFKTLDKVFEKKATSYKYFWMMAIISLAKEHNQLSISFNDITIRMAAMAWPIVFESEIELGSNDMMKNYLEAVVKKTSLIRAASSKVVEDYLQQHYSSQGVDKILAPLMKNVPYRFLSPWVQYTSDEEVIEKSCSSQFNGLYALYPNFIVFNEDWWEYIDSHYLEVCDFVMRSFITYAKKYNNDISLVKLMTTGWSLIKK